MHPIDLTVLVTWLVLSVGAGIWAGRRSSHTAEGFFAADRSLPWWVVGTSMVATTFAADTPLVVSGLVVSRGIVGNWTWWWLGAAGLASVFLFAHLWRRAQVLTDAELTELRYSGPPAAFLRGLKAVWFGGLMNILTIAWVMGAMSKVLAVVLDLPPTLLGLPSAQAVVLGLFLLTVVYTTASGLFGVVATDVIQFVVAMLGSITLAALAWVRVGGAEGLSEALTTAGFTPSNHLTLWPTFEGGWSSDGALVGTVLLITWWGSKQIDGGGYLAQRLFAAKDERHATLSYLWFTVANLCLRPWPWIMVGLVGMALLGPLDDPERYYPAMMQELLPPGLFGLLLASFLAAFMSTIDTQLNWGSSVLTRDLVVRFWRPRATTGDQVTIGRLVILTLAAVGAAASMYIDSLRGAWELAFSVTAGLGTVYIARWYWWRTNAYSELTAMIVAAVGTFTLPVIIGSTGWFPPEWARFPFNAAIITLVGLPIWIGVTLATRPTERSVLDHFQALVHPGGPGWRRLYPDAPSLKGVGLRILVGSIAVYGVLMGTGMVILGPVWPGLAVLAAATLLGLWILPRLPMPREQQAPPEVRSA